MALMAAHGFQAAPSIRCAYPGPGFRTAAHIQIAAATSEATGMMRTACASVA